MKNEGAAYFDVEREEISFLVKLLRTVSFFFSFSFIRTTSARDNETWRSVRIMLEKFHRFGRSQQKPILENTFNEIPVYASIIYVYFMRK